MIVRLIEWMNEWLKDCKIEWMQNNRNWMIEWFNDWMVVRLIEWMIKWL